MWIPQSLGFLLSLLFWDSKSRFSGKLLSFDLAVCSVIGSLGVRKLHGHTV